MDYSSLGDRSRMKRRHSDLQRRGLASGLSPEKNIVREDHQNAPPDRLSLPIVVRWCGYILLAIFLGCIVLLYSLPSPVDPVSFKYSSRDCPAFVGPLEVNDYLKNARIHFENEIMGPEGITTDERGDIYTGLGDGRIIRINKDLSSYQTVARTGDPPYDSCGTELHETQCGRPLGLEFCPEYHDDLYVADSSMGLLKVNVKTGSVETLLSVGTKVGENRINMLNDLVLLKNGTILISESSHKFSRAENRLELLESRDNGRLLYYNLQDKSYGVLLNGIHFSNGICLSHSGDSVLIAETTRARILRYYLSGPKAGKTDYFIENLPGLPDNISPSSAGNYWVGIALVRTMQSDYLASAGVQLRRILAKLKMLIPLVEMLFPKHGLVLEIGTDGQIVRSLHDQGGYITFATSHILDRGDNLIIGSYFAPFLVQVDIEST